MPTLSSGRGMFPIRGRGTLGLPTQVILLIAPE